jgi:hypothetical protein
MLVYIRSLNAIIFSYLTKDNRKTNNLVIETDIKFIFLWIEVVIRQEIELHLFLNCYFLLVKANHISLVDHKLRFRDFIAMYYFLFHLYNVLVRLLLIYSFSWLVDQT